MLQDVWTMVVDVTENVVEGHAIDVIKVTNEGHTLDYYGADLGVLALKPRQGPEQGTFLDWDSFAGNGNHARHE